MLHKYKTYKKKGKCIIPYLVKDFIHILVKSSIIVFIWFSFNDIEVLQYRVEVELK